MKTLVTTAALLLTATIAHAEADRPNASDTKSEATATTLSVAGTLAPVAVGAAALALPSTMDGQEAALPFVGLAAVGALVGPSIGHWYAGNEIMTKGLWMRVGGAAVSGAGMYLTVTACFPEGCGSRSPLPGGLLVAGGAGLFVAGTIHDIATAGRAVRRYNEKQLHVAPTIVSDGRTKSMGLGVSGTF